MRYILFCLLFSISLSAQISLTTFGGKGDGATDNTAAFESAFAALQTGGKLTIPPGVFCVNNTGAEGPLLPHSYTVIEGSGMGATTIKYCGTAHNTEIISLVYGSGYGSQITLQDLTVMGRNVPGTVGVYAGSPSLATPKTAHIYFERARITQCDTGVQTGDVWDISWHNSLIEYNLGYGIQFAEADAVTTAVIANTRIGNNGNTGILHSGTMLTQLIVDQGSEVSYNGGTEVVLGASRDVEIRDAWFEEDTMPQIAVDITNCRRCLIDGIHSDHPSVGIYSSTPTSNIRIVNSSFTNEQQAISLPAGSTGMVMNNYASLTSISPPSTVAHGNNSTPSSART